MNRIEKRLERVFREVFGRRELNISHSMTADDIEGWDSLMNITLIIAIEKEFSIKFTVGELAQLGDVGDIIALIKERSKHNNKKREGPV